MRVKIVVFAVILFLLSPTLVSATLNRSNFSILDVKTRTGVFDVEVRNPVGEKEWFTFVNEKKEDNKYIDEIKERYKKRNFTELDEESFDDVINNQTESDKNEVQSKIQEKDQRISELEDRISSLQKTIDRLQDKIQEMNNTRVQEDELDRNESKERKINKKARGDKGFFGNLFGNLF